MSFNPVASFGQGLGLGQDIRTSQRNNQINDLKQSIAQQSAQGGFNPNNSLELQQLSVLDQNSAAKILSTYNALDDKRKGAGFQDARKALKMLESGDDEGFLNVATDRIGHIKRLNGNPAGTLRILSEYENGNKQGAVDLLRMTEKEGIELGFLSDPLDREIKKARGGISSETKTFQDLLAKAGLSEEEAQTAARIKLGLDPRAVGSADQTISQKGIANQIGDVKATIKQREKFGELTASRRSKVIDNGFNKIEKINAAVGNIDRAIEVLNGGAGVGAIEKYLPSFKAASVELDNIQKSMALDVIGATTFGALSEGELNLAKEVALPTGLDTPQLIEYLNKRKSAQNKLRDYYNEQIQFLDQGGTVAGFMRAKGRNKSQTEQPASSTNNGQLSDSDLLKKYGG
jgi:hypothetical protein